MLRKSQSKWPASVVMVISLPLFTSGQNFTDVTATAGIDHEYIVFEGLFGGGACVIDVNNDGWEDLYITGGMRDDVMYLNNGDGTFRNIIESAGLAVTRKYMTQGVASADVNRDGWRDLFVTTIKYRDSTQVIPRAENLLFINNGDLTFRDATKEYGLDQFMSFSTGACFGDFDHDGYPDLYVANYFEAYEGPLSEINDATIVNANQTSKGFLFKNVKGKRFENVYDDYGMIHKGFGWGGSFTDFDNDGDVDLFAHHDFGYKAKPDAFLENMYPKKRFQDVSKATNLDLRINAMGTGVGDYNNDGWLDYYVTNIRFNAFMVNEGRGKPFRNATKELGVDFISISWGANFADFDHDGDEDLFVANGDLNPNVVPLANYYFVNDGGRFTDQAHVVGLNDYGVGRGSVVFDMDNDGDPDILVVNQKPVKDYPVESRTKLFRNDLSSGNWLKVALRGNGSERNGLGCRVRVVAGGLSMIREIDGGSGHESQNSIVAHFGLGAATVVDSVIVTWTGGMRQVLTKEAVNSFLTIIEPEEKRSNAWLYGTILVAMIVAGIGAKRRFQKPAKGQKLVIQIKE